jgi:opacity protein-like surface antigen
MKKILTTLACLVGLQGFALADTTNVGIKLSYGNFDAKGSETTDLASEGAIAKSGDADFPFASVFIERDFALKNFNVALGLDYIPLEAEIDTIGGTTGFNAKVEVKDQFTLYVQPSKKLDNGVTVFGKLGYSQADLQISQTTRQASTDEGASTDTGASRDLEGPMIGLGVEKELPNNAFVRLEVSYTDYDEISYTNSQGKILKASAELTAAHLSIGKKF